MASTTNNIGNNEERGESCGHCSSFSTPKEASSSCLAESNGSSCERNVKNHHNKRFAECALVEIIHLHDCLRGALQQMITDVNSLVKWSVEASGKKTSDDDDNDLIDLQPASNLERSIASRFHLIWCVFQAHSGAEDEFIWPALELKLKPQTSSSPMGNNNKTNNGATCCFGAKEYVEDHAEEEKQFQQVNATLRRLKGSFRFYEANKSPRSKRSQALYIIGRVISLLKEQIDGLAKHLVQHLQKEETQCLPMLQKHLNKDEIRSLVGQIMGKRSAELMGKILDLAVFSLPEDEREDMVQHMKNAMAGTFFAKWLDLWSTKNCQQSFFSNSAASSENKCKKRKRSETSGNEEADSMPTRKISFSTPDITAEIASRKPPSRYFKRQKSGKIVQLYDRSISTWNPSCNPLHSSVPLFTTEELTPTYHSCSPSNGNKLGCTHYSRACKLRHPITGQLFTCRLCCEERREANSYDDSLPPLDRNEVTEVLCMRCNTLQPTGPNCVSNTCKEKPRLARYFCNICNLYDDANREIYHCPYCNVCRKGKGLGIDFRHCMRCNACIAIGDYDNHACIPHRLQGQCPICRESLFESTEPLRGLPCGHVMHLNCFNLYVTNSSRFGKISCPYCKLVIDNINEWTERDKDNN